MKKLAKFLFIATIALLVCLTLASCDLFPQKNTSHTHKFGQWVEGVSATCTEEGNVGYYYCSGCKKYFAADKETVIDDIKITASGHSLKDLLDQHKMNLVLYYLAKN